MLSAVAFFGLLALLPLVASSKVCFDITIPVTVDSTNYIWGRKKFDSNLDITALNFDYNRRDFATTFNPLSGTENKTATYNIAGSFCRPISGPGSTLLIATHGATLDRYYWDWDYQPSNYSFVDFAVGRGYSVFYYDRLGAGQSSVVSGYVNQLSIQVSILHFLVLYAKSGKLQPPEFQIPLPFPYRPQKVILVAHSLGSIITNALIAAKPTIVDGAILTGWGYNSGLSNSFGLTVATWQPKIAHVQLSRWNSYDSGYVVSVDIYAYIQTFYKDQYYDMSAVQHAYNQRWPFAVMEFFTLPTLTFPAPGFTTPVLFLVGEFDDIMCGGYCPGVLEPAARSVFPASVGYESYIQPKTGHILNTALNATGSYQVMTNFLAQNGF